MRTKLSRIAVGLAASLFFGTPIAAQCEPPFSGGVLLPDQQAHLIADWSGPSGGAEEFPSEEITIQMWLRKEFSPVAGIFSFSTSLGPRAFTIENLNNIGFTVAGSGRPNSGVDVEASNPGGWNHLTVARRASDGRWDVYVNGQLEFSGTFVAGIPIPNDGDGCMVLGDVQEDFCGGFRQFAAFVGSYSDVRIWSVFRTEAEIAADFDKRLVGDEPGLVRYWPLSGVTGLEAFDLVDGQSLQLVGAVRVPAATGCLPSFSYSGLLSRDGEPATEPTDIVFSLYDSDDGTSPPLASIQIDGIAVDEGVFTASPGFDSALLDGTPRWLGLEVRFAGEPGFTPVAGLQPIGGTAGAIEATTRRDPSLPGPDSIWTYRADATALLTNAARLGIGDAAPGARVSVFAFNEPASRFSGTAAAGLFMSSGQSPIGVEAINDGSGQAIGLRGSASSPAGTGVIGVASDTTSTNFGVYGQTLSPEGFGVYSNGRLGASGTKSFVVDHPLDPENALLYHYSTEGPSPQNAYNGIATLDDQGRAWVTLPDYFEKINIDPRYQLTPIGAPAQVYISSEIDRGVFQIAGGEPGMRVSWQVKADRADRFVLRHGAPSEKDKAPAERGVYVRPDLFEAVRTVDETPTR